MVRGALLMFRFKLICFFPELKLNLVHGDELKDAVYLAEI